MEKLKRLREASGLSQVKLAARADLNPATVNQIERGMRDASPGTLRKLADALGVSLYELMEEEAPKAQAPLPLEVADAPQRGYLPLSHMLEDWRYLIESTAARHIQNAASNLFETVEGASAYSIAAFIETAQLFEIYLERLSPTIRNALPESVAEIESGKLALSMFQLEEAQEAISKAAKDAGVPLNHDHELSEAEIAIIEETFKEYKSLSDLERRRWVREGWEIVDRLAETHIANARDLTEEMRSQSSA